MTDHPPDQPIPTFIRMSKLIKAPRQRVYEAWINPEIRRQWWCAAPEYCSSQCEIDAAVGGRYRINMEKQGEEYVTVGEFVQMDPPAKLVFTWTWEKPADGVKNTLVTVELFDVQIDGQPATELVLTHEKLSDPRNREAHTSGWTGCLTSLAQHLDPHPVESA